MGRKVGISSAAYCLASAIQEDSCICRQHKIMSPHTFRPWLPGTARVRPIVLLGMLIATMLLIAIVYFARAQALEYAQATDALQAALQSMRADEQQRAAAAVQALHDRGRIYLLCTYLAGAGLLAQLIICYFLIVASSGARRNGNSDSAANEAALELRSAEATRLSRHLLTSREAERLRVARKLHDELGSNLTAVNMDVSWVRQRTQDAPLAERLARAGAVIGSTVQLMRSIIQELPPTALDSLGLSAALEIYTTDLAQRTGIAIATDLPDALPRLREGCAITAFRIAQEALDNAAHHAQASAIKLSVRLEGSNIALEVSDDGIGIDLAAAQDAASAHGLLSMRERALQMGGSVIVERRAQGPGTRVHATLPCVDATAAGLP